MVFLLAAIFFLGLGADPSSAHLAPEEHGSLMAGLSHPLFGIDHVLAMVTVGLWAAMLGGRALWLVPAAFVGAMLAGFGLSLSGLALPLVEPAILASVIVVGLLTAIAASVPVAAGMAIVAVCGAFHGYAHGGELGSAGAFGYAVGFVVATTALHGLGAVAGVGLLKLLGGLQGLTTARVAGAIVTAAGLALAVGS